MEYVFRMKMRIPTFNEHIGSPANGFKTGSAKRPLPLVASETTHRCSENLTPLVLGSPNA